MHQEHLADIVWMIQDSERPYLDVDDYEFVVALFQKDGVLQHCYKKDAVEDGDGVHQVHRVADFDGMTADDIVTVVKGRLEDLIYDAKEKS